ncbi:Uncharacterised protein [Mycobacteroides abscessus subsp. bolletii]|uniref:hypothetical protein n=1 Tax=Mycobacteroides abscessus TaxID=36809 RepID=UPI0009A630CC|nr:hypothetical protein [Mycobacteroides abscessus]SKX80577.1 Uncharacterised protein [Mycobacteroides abscessus subsp. bolletii]
MTNATHTVRTVTEHRFNVPCPWPEGGDWQDFGVALAWAEKVAEQHGISTSTDNWSRLRVEDDQLVIVLTVEGNDEAPR